jgi:hypothetical protein
MRGFPKHLNTSDDVQVCLQMFPEETKRHLAALYQNRFVVKELRVLSGDDAGIIDDLHEVVQRESSNGTVERVQLQKVEDPSARAFQLGLTDAKVEALVGQQTVNPDKGGEIGASGI